MLSTQQYRNIYALLDTVNPVPYDCGRMCGSICCSNEPFADGDSYIYLLPGEKEFLEENHCNFPIERQRRKEHYLPASWGKYVYIVRCPGKDICDRRFRPIQCRTFPLQPRLDQDDRLELVMCNTDLPYTCPLIRDRMELSEDFVRITLRAWEMLMEDEAVRDLVKMDSDQEK